jgi:hypothetical protein
MALYRDVPGLRREEFELILHKEPLPSGTMGGRIQGLFRHTCGHGRGCRLNFRSRVRRRARSDFFFRHRTHAEQVKDRLSRPSQLRWQFSAGGPGWVKRQTACGRQRTVHLRSAPVGVSFEIDLIRQGGRNMAKIGSAKGWATHRSLPVGLWIGVAGFSGRP